MHYLIYVPGVVGADNGHLDRRGLAALRRDRAPEWAELERGPDGKRGMLCTWRKGDAATDPPLGLAPSQEWKPCRPVKAASLARGAYWIGIDREKPVKPEDVERVRPYPGYWLKLADGQEWHCPTAAMFPHRHGLDDEGQYERTVDPAFAQFWDRSRAYAEQMFQAIGQLNLMQALEGKRAPQKLDVEFDLADAFDFTVQALSYNYRLNAELATRLGLIDDDALRNVIKAAIDLPVLIDVRAEKKSSRRVAIDVG